MLKEKDEILLNAFIDGELSFFDNLKAKRLLSSNSAAQKYVDDLKQVSISLKDVIVSEQSSLSVDLWEKIDARIDQEEKAEFFLGSRRADSSKEAISVADRVTNFISKGAWSMAGGLVAASITFMLMNQSNTPGTSQNLASGAPVILEQTPKPVELVSMNSNSNRGSSLSRWRRKHIAQQQQLLKRINNQEMPFEVDWMKSDGRVTFIQDPRKKATVIWVKKRNNVNPDRPVVLEREPQLMTPFNQ